MEILHKFEHLFFYVMPMLPKHMFEQTLASLSVRTAAKNIAYVPRQAHPESLYCETRNNKTPAPRIILRGGNAINNQPVTVIIKPSQLLPDII